MSFCNFKADSDDDDDFRDEDYNFSSDYNEEFRTNSSSSSLKWSVDARRQNEEDWLSIERILYAEESLPEGKDTKKKVGKIIDRVCLYFFFLTLLHFLFVRVDDKTKEEFQSWMRAFPHLRYEKHCFFFTS